MFVAVMVTNILFSQNVRIDAKLLNNTASKVELRSAYDTEAPVYATLDIKGDAIAVRAEIPQTDLFALVFDEKTKFLLCLSPNEKIKLTIDVANPLHVPQVSGSQSILFSKQLTDLLLSRQDCLDSLNREVQNNKTQIYFSSFVPSFRTYIQSAQEADVDVVAALERNDSLVKLLDQCATNGVVNKKMADQFMYESIKHLKLMKNYYATFTNHLSTVAENFDINGLGKVDGYTDFYKDLSLFSSSINEHNALIKNLMQDYCDKVASLLSAYDDQFYDGKLDAPKAKLNFCNEIASIVFQYGPAASKKKSDIESNSLLMKTMGNKIATDAQNNIEKIVASYQKQFNEKNEQIANQSRSMMVEHKSDLASLMFLDNFSQDKALQSEVITALHEAYPEHALVTERYNKINNPQFRTSEGSIAPELEFSDPTGKVRKLSDLRGKVVLIDFWASWCGPCRRENPHVVAMYAKYHDKGFEVFSVSLDNNRDKWIEAIAKDNLSWPNHVSDLKGWGSAAAKLYGVNSIPCTFLIDQEGRIIAKGLRGQQLTDVLERIFGK